MPQADGPGRPTPKKVKRKSVGKAVSGATKKRVDFGEKPKPGVANAGVGAPAKGKIVVKKNPRVVADSKPTPKLKRAGMLHGTAPIGFLGKDAPLREPALKVLDVAARPLYAVANAKKQELINQGVGDPAKKGSVLKAAGRGLKGEDKTVGSDVLKQAGVKNKVVRAIGGTAYDLAVIAAYPGLRGGSLSKSGAEIAGEKAAKKALKKAARSGAAPHVAERFANKAGKKAIEEASKKRGVWLGVGYGKHGQVRVSHRTDRTIFRKGWMGEEPQPPSKLGDQAARVVREPVSHVRPTVRKRGSSDLGDHNLVRDIKREQRATIQKGRKTAQVRYDAVSRAVPPEHHAVVSHAVETRSLKGVPPELHDTVRKLIAQSKHSKRRRAAVGLGADVTNTVKLPKVAPDVNATRHALSEARKAERAARSAERKAGKRVVRARVREAEAKGVAVTRVGPEDRKNLASYLAEFEGKHPLSVARRNMNKARKEQADARKAFGNRARYNNQGLYDTSGAAARKAKAEKAFVAAKKAHDVEYQRLMDRAGVEFGKAQRGESHDAALAALGRGGQRAPLERLSTASADVAGEQAVLSGAVKRVEAAGERVSSAEKAHAAESVAQKDYRRRVRLRGGDASKPPKGYMAHIREEDLNTGSLEDPLRPGSAAGGRWTGKRKVKKTIREQNAKAKPEDRLVEDPAALVANAESRDSRLIAARELAVKAREVGRPLPRGKYRVKLSRGAARKTKTKGYVHVRDPKKTLTPTYDVSGVKSHEVVVHVGSDLRRLSDREVAALRRGDFTDLPTGGQYRVMAREHFDALTHTPVQSAGHWARYITRPWKAVATATPAFQIRNLVGDEARVFDAGVPLHDIPRLNYQGAQAVHYMRQNEGAFGATAAGKTVNLGKSGSVSMKDWVKELERNGIFQSGIRNSELAHMGGDQMGHFGGRITSKNFPEWAAKRQRFREEIDAIAREAGHPLHELAKAFQNRENMTYATLYKHFRELGQGEREATRNTMDALIDYGAITDFERMLRNSVFPFYTFSARVVPFYAKTLLKRPGKIAFYEAVRQELGNLFGQNPDHLQYEAAYRQRLAGFPIAGKWVSMGLPVSQGLNELPTTLNPAAYAKELLRYTFGVLSPWAKIPTELVPVIYGQPGFNFFFEAPLESPYSRFTPAPVVPGVPWEKIPKGTREKLGVKQIELRDGSLVWAWRGYKSYLLNVVTPGAPGFALRAGQDVSRRGQNKTQQWASFLTGVKIDNPDPVGAALGNAYSRKSLLEGMRSDIGQEKNGKNSPEYLKLSKQIKDLDILINGLSRKRGDKKQLGHPPAKAKVRAKKQDGLGLDLSSGSSDSGLGLDMSSGSSGSGLGLDLGS